MIGFGPDEMPLAPLTANRPGRLPSLASDPTASPHLPQGETVSTGAAGARAERSPRSPATPVSV